MCDCLTWHHPIWAVFGRRAGVKPGVVWSIFAALRDEDPVFDRLSPQDKVQTLAIGLGWRPAEVALVLASLQHSGVVDDDLRLASEWRPNRPPNAEPDAQPDAASAGDDLLGDDLLGDDLLGDDLLGDDLLGDDLLGSDDLLSVAAVRRTRGPGRRVASTGAERMRRCRAKQRASVTKSPEQNVTSGKNAPLSLVPTSVVQEGMKEVKAESARASPQQLSLMMSIEGGAPPPPEPEPTKGREDERTARGSRLPADWQPGPAEIAYAQQLGLDAADTADRFRDYWTEQPGARGRKLTWTGTWRNWCRGDADKQSRTARIAAGRKSPAEKLYSGFAAAAGFDSGADSAPSDPLLDRRRPA